MLQAIGVFALASSGGAARWLHVGGAPWLRPYRAQKGGRMKGAGPHFHIVGLGDDAALIGPIVLQGHDQVLKGRWWCINAGAQECFSQIFQLDII